MNNFKLEIGKLLAEIRAFFTRCDCNNPNIFVEYKFIDTNTKMWRYNIVCSYCGKIHYKSDSKK